MTQLIEVAGREIRITGSRLRVSRLEGEFYHFLSDPAPLIASLRNLPDRPDLFTFMQGAADPAPRYSYHTEWDNMAVVRVSTFEHWWNHQLQGKSRNQARLAAKKNVVVREVPFSDDLVRGIQAIFNETPIRQGRRFPHYGEDFDTVYREEATFLEHATFIGAYLDDKLIGFIKLVTDEERTQAGMMNILAMISHRDKAPNNALIAEAVRVCAARGIPNLVYFRFVHGKRERDSVSEFKVKNGFERIDVPRYFVPLTPWGRTALALGFHHRFVDRLPESLGEKLRALRSRWYNRQSTSTRAGVQP